MPYRNDFEGGDIVNDSDEEEDEAGDARVPVHAKQGAPMKDWNSLGPHQKRRESQKAFDELRKIATARNVEPERVAGSLLRR